MTDLPANRIARRLAREIAAERLEVRRALHELRHHARELDRREIRGVSRAITEHAERIEAFLERAFKNAKALALITGDEPTNPGVTPPHR